MIEFHSETDFHLDDEERYRKWIADVIVSEGFELGEILYIFCDDEYLHRLNLEFLNHDTLTDILSFDYGMGKEINGEIYISIERVLENAAEFSVEFSKELRRVMIHGILHFMGFKDNTTLERKTMRLKEDEYLKRFPLVQP